MIDSHASLQSSYSCKLNTVEWVVELTYLQVIVKCESFSGGHGKARCNVNCTRGKLDKSRIWSNTFSWMPRLKLNLAVLVLIMAINRISSVGWSQIYPRQAFISIAYLLLLSR